MVYVKDFCFEALLKANMNSVDREKELFNIISSFSSDFSNKVRAIKAVREYCNKNNYSKYLNLGEAKELVESLRREWRFPSSF